MAKLKARITAASEKIAAALAILMGEDEASVAEAMATQKENTKARETGDDEEEEKPKRGPGRPRKLKAPAEDEEEDTPKRKKAAAADDDDDDDADEADSKIPKDSALAELSRAELKALATANDLDPAGKNREDLTKLLQEKRDGKGSGKSKKPVETDDDEDEDAEETPKKTAKKKDADADEDKPEEDDYPSTKEMKKDLEVFIKLNKEMLKDAGFFGGKPKKGTQPVGATYDDIMADVDQIKEAWADNVWPSIQDGSWKKKKAQAAELDDEDDDE